MSEDKYAGHEPEVIACARDFVHFCENYVKIVHPIKGLVDFKLHDFQKRYAKTLEDHRFVIGKKFRQGGFTTTNMAWIVWRLLFRLDERILVVCKSDREACWTSSVVKGILNQLPEWMVPEYGKFNDHRIENKETGCTVMFYTAEAARGQNVNYLFFEEAAFIPNMDAYWKCVWPCLSTGGHCVVMSTVNGKGNWFHKTYTDAAEGRNDFHVFECSYVEHPDYNNVEWVGKTREALGDRGWRQEVLGEFLDPQESKIVWQDPFASFDLKKEFGWDETKVVDEAKKIILEVDGLSEEKKPKPPLFEKADDFWVVKTPQEESARLHECRKRAYEEAQKRGKDRPESNFGDIKDNFHEPHLTHDELFDANPACTLTFDTVERPHSFRGYVWPNGAEQLAEEHIFLGEDYSLHNSIEKKKQNLRDLEDRLNEHLGVFDDDLLVLAGVLEEGERSTPAVTKPSGGSQIDQEVLAKVLQLGRFPESLKISFQNKQFCVNGVPTNIKEFDVCCLYSGLAAFIPHDKAVTKVAKLICKRMTPLFGLPEEK